MKTMLELLIRLHEMRCCCERARRNSQLSQGEKAVAFRYKQIVRECLPAAVLVRYDRMKTTERALRSCPEVFAMAVLVSTFRGLPPQGRRKLVAHFALPPKRRELPSQRAAVDRGSRNPVRSAKANNKTFGEPRSR